MIGVISPCKKRLPFQHLEWPGAAKCVRALRSSGDGDRCWPHAQGAPDDSRKMLEVHTGWGPQDGASSEAQKKSCWFLSFMVYMRVSINGGTPIAGWFIMENPIKMDDLRAPLFQETTIWHDINLVHEINKPTILNLAPSCRIRCWYKTSPELSWETLLTDGALEPWFCGPCGSMSKYYI